MPPLRFLSMQDKAESLPPITNYGHYSGFFESVDSLFREMGKGDPEIDINNSDRIKATLLRTGPCPGNARVYHQFNSELEIESRDDEIESILGKEVNVSRRNAGQLFEEWVDDINKALNTWLKTGNESDLREADVPQNLKEHYLEQLDEISEKASELGINLEELEMSTQHEVFTEYFHPSEPDGVWLPDDIPGGVFESKLTVPPEPVDKHQLAGYAVHLERSEGIPMDFGVYLSLDESLDEIEVNTIYLDDIIRGRIRENIEIFASIAFQSRASGNWNEDEPVKDRLVEPEEPRYANMCRSCPYTSACHEDGKYYDLLESIYDEISNLKLSGNQIRPVLDAVHEGAPERHSVSNAVMSLFPTKSEKSVFRGMVIPTLKRLELIRVRGEGRHISLSPNGKMVILGDSDQRLSFCVRDYLVEELGLTYNAMEYFRDYSDTMSQIEDYSNFDENISRLENQFIEYFDLFLPKEDQTPSVIQTVYSDHGAKEFLSNKQKRVDWMSGALPKNQQIQYDEARWRLIDWLLDRDLEISSWFVDEAVWKEWLTEDPAIDLWEGSTHSSMRLAREGIPYDAIVLN